jgi:hypothetical protein
VPGDLEEAIMEAAVAYIVYELLLCGRVIAVECFTMEVSNNSSEHSRSCDGL